MTARCKYDELRLKTDQQLIKLANAQLDLGIGEAHEAVESAENWAAARGHYILANRALAQAARLVCLIGGDELETRLAHLREVLKGLSVLSASGAPSGEETRVLAHALWRAKGCPEGSAQEDWLQAERVLQSHATCAAS